jgi:hypothetical protein
MAVIDLGNGEVERTAASQPVGRIIDLGSGEFIDPPAAVSVQPIAQPVQQEPAQPLSQLIPQAAEAIGDIQAPDTGVADVFTGSERIAATPELGTLPEFGGTPEGDTARIAAGLLSTFDPKAQQDIILEQIPEAVFETTPDGSTIVEVPTEGGGTRRSVLNRPGFSPQDLTTATAQLLSFIPAARIATLGKSLLQKLAIGGTAAGVTEQALQEVGVELGRKERDPAATAIATVTGGAAEVVVPAIQAFRGARQVAKAGAAQDEIAQVARSVSEAQEATQATGIPLFQAQQTGIPAQLEKQSFVAQLPAGTRSAIEGLKTQNKAAGDAVEDFLGQIAPDQAVVTGAERLRTAAQAAIEKAKNIRAEKASPLFKEAFDESPQVELQPIRKLISDKLVELPEAGEIAKTLKKVAGLIAGKKPKETAAGLIVDEAGRPITAATRAAAPVTLKQLHNAKLEIDQMLNKFGENSLGNTTKREITEVKNLLLAQIDEASPSYKAARETFAEASPPVTKIQDSIIGKVANLDDTQLKQVSSKLFDAAETNPSVIAGAKKSIQDVDPGAWDEIIRVELERRLGSIKSTADAGTIENIPGQLFRALFPNEKSTKVLMNSLDAEGKKNLKYLRTALGKARLGRPGGSPTAGREEIKRELRGGIFQSFRDFFKAPISTLVSTGEDAAFNRSAAALSKALFDPTWKAEMKAIRQFSPKSPAAARAMTQLLNDIGASQEQSTQAQ